MSSTTQNRKPSLPFADIAEVVSIENLRQEDLQDFEKEAGIKYSIVLKVKSTQRFAGKVFEESLHYSAKVADAVGLKVGDQALVKARVKEGSRYLSYVTIQNLKK